MTGFDFAFALFSLLLGLSMAEIFQGFARVLKLHAEAHIRHEKRVRVGWLVPLLAILVMLYQLSFWMQAYAVRNTLPFTYITMLVVTIMVGGYYLFSTLVFPEKPEEWPDFDLYYDQYNRLILSGLLVIGIASIYLTTQYGPGETAHMKALDAGPAGTIAALGMLGAVLLTFILIFVRRRWLNLVLLVALIGLFLGGTITFAVAGLTAP